MKAESVLLSAGVSWHLNTFGFKISQMRDLQNLQINVAANVCLIVQCDERGAFRWPIIVAVNFLFLSLTFHLSLLKQKCKKSYKSFLLHSRAEAQEECSTEKMEEDKCSEGEEDKKLPEPPEAQSSADEGGGRSWWMMDVLGDSDKDSGHGSKSGSSCWDFSSISFPDLGSTSREHFPSDLAPPDPSLLPGDLKVGFCDIAPWRQKINLRQVKMSANEQKREKYRRRWDVNKNREVCKD